jgi:hypothetical protein
MQMTKKEITLQPDKNESQDKVHPWRLCPAGEHWVRVHEMHTPPSKEHPEGYITTRHEHCARNPSGKDVLYPDEIKKISEQHFSDLKNKPCPLELGFHGIGNKYDNIIAGWVQYWNDILKPDIPLTPNLIKALIASESKFNPNILANKKNQNSARGLTQIRNDTRKILGNEKGELKNHYVNATKEDLNDPIVNICAGIRWFFQKKALASSFLGRSATWEETVAEYKGTKTATKEEAKKIMDIFNRYLKDLEKCEKS